MTKPVILVKICCTLLYGIQGVIRANFFHCWITDSTWLECAESLITAITFMAAYLEHLFTNFRPVLPVSSSLVHLVRPASSWPRDSLS